jgi:hypothetical protein
LARIGGEREQMMTVKGAHKLFLLSRKGFVKLAIEQAASLVPIYIFGETDLFSHHQWGIGARLWMVRKLGTIGFRTEFQYQKVFARDTYLS